MERRVRRNHFSSAAASIPDHLLRRGEPPLSATCGLMHRSKPRGRLQAIYYSITSSARASSDGGTVRPSVLTVLRS